MAAYASLKITYGKAFLNTIAAAWKTTASGALILDGKLRLNTNPSFNPSAEDTIAGNAANEADYSGYTAGGIAVTLSAPVNLSATCVGAICSGTFAATTDSPFVSSVVYGYWIDDGTNVIAAEAFPTNQQVTFGTPGDFLELVVQLPIQAVQLTA